MNVSVQHFCLQNNLVRPIITPRFALSCDMTLMTMLGELASRCNVHIQVIYFIAYLSIQYHIFFYKFFLNRWQTLEVDVMGRECGMCRGEERCIQGFGGEI